MEKNTSSVEELFHRTTGYIETRVELIKLKAINKGSGFASMIVAGLAVAIVFFLFIIMANIGLALWLGTLLGHAYLGFFIVTGFYLILLLVLIFSRKSILQAPVKTAIIKSLLN